MARHDLIAVATTHWPDAPEIEARPQLSNALAGIVKLFTQTLGRYRRQLEEYSENPTSKVLGDQLDDWFAHEDRDNDDWVVFYYTGHAEAWQDSLYLLTTDFKEGRYASKALGIKQLADMVAAPRGSDKPRKIKKLLAIIDTCHAGEGARELAAHLAESLQRTSGVAFYLLGAALPREMAQAGALTEALIAAVEELSRRHVGQRWLYFDQIVPAINRRLNRSVQSAVLSQVTSPDEEPQFFPNPSYVDIADSAVPADEAWRAINDQEYRDHWAPRARGVEFNEQQGQYFTGRGEVLARIRAFLEQDDDRRTRVVTGSPGSGKSAILSRVVMEAKSGAGGRLDLAIHAKSKSLDDLVARFAVATGSAVSVDAVLDHLRGPGASYRIIVDALDEAAEPEAIARRLLAPLSEIGAVKLVVGTRERYVDLLSAGEVVDIDESGFVSEHDIADYVEARLLRKHEPPQPTPYAGKETLAREIAQAVARKAYPNYFVARLIVENLLSRRRAISPNSSEDMAFPTQVSEAFDEWLARFGGDETRVRDLLLPLAYAEGAGLPWDNIWAPLASVLSRRDYSDEDIYWLLEHAGAFVLETVESGRSVYRLYHQALVDTLRQQNGRNVDAMFSDVIVASTPRRTDRDEPDWLQSNPYTRMHLAAHASRAGRLNWLLEQPLYMLAAEPSRLLQAVAVTSCDSRLVSVYRACEHRLSIEPAHSAVAYLELAAMRQGLMTLADAAGALPFRRPWCVPWMRQQRALVPRLLAYVGGDVGAVSVGIWRDDRPVLVVGRRRGSIQIYDLEHETLLASWTPRFDVMAAPVACAMTDAGPVIAAIFGGNQIGTYFPDSGQEAFGRALSVSKLHVVRRRGEFVCVVVRSGRLGIRRLSDFEILVQRNSRPINIDELRLATHRGKSVLITSGYSRRARASFVCMWALDDLSLLWEHEYENGRGGMGIESHHIDGRNLLLVLRRRDKYHQIWDIDTLTLCFESTRPIDYAWLVSYRGEVLLIEKNHQTLSAFRLRKSADWSTYIEEPLGRRVETGYELFDILIYLRGLPTLLSREPSHLRAWDVHDLLVEMQTDRRFSVAASAVCVFSGKPSTIWVSSRNGAFEINSTDGTLGRSFPLAQCKLLVPIENLPAVAVGLSEPNFIRRIDFEPQSEGVPIEVGYEVVAVRAVAWHGRTLAFVSTRTDGGYLIRVWDLDFGTEIEMDPSFLSFQGEEDRRILALTLVREKERFWLAVASGSNDYGKIKIAAFVGAVEKQIDDPLTSILWGISPDFFGRIWTLASISTLEQRYLAAGTTSGTIAIWHGWHGEPRAVHAKAHSGCVHSLEFGTLEGRRVLASGGEDRMLRIWTYSLEEIYSIEIGDVIWTLSWLGDDSLVVGDELGGVLLVRFSPGRNYEQIRHFPSELR